MFSLYAKLKAKDFPPCLTEIYCKINDEFNRHLLNTSVSLKHWDRYNMSTGFMKPVPCFRI